MSKTPLPPLLEDLLDSLGGPPTDAYRADIEAAAKAMRRDEHLREALRGPRRPEIDAWIGKQLSADPSLKSPQLWERAPQSIKDQIGTDRFKKRVTKMRRVAKG